MRHYSFLDNVLGTLQDTFGILNNFRDPSASSPHNQDQHPHSLQNPMLKAPEAALSVADRTQAIRMLRVDHAGEICAQALYLAQARTAKTADITKHMQQAAKEEEAHLRWCKERLMELNGRTSWLNPFWAKGAYCMGVIAGLAGDGWNLGFLAETEKQVTEHLNQQLSHLSVDDHRTRAILTQMRDDEQEHEHHAMAVGAKELPLRIKVLMRCFAKVMTTTAQYI